MKPVLLLTLGAVLASAQASPNPPNTIPVIHYEVRPESQPILDRHGKPKLDRQGNPKTKQVFDSVQTVRNVPMQAGLLYYVDTNTQLLATQSFTQYNYVSPSCLNSFWCHLLAGDPSAQTTTQPISVTSTWFGLIDARSKYVYICRETGVSVQSFTVNKAVAFGFDDDLLILVDDNGNNHKLQVIQKQMPLPQ
jgi:hypothetical protein